MEIVDSNGCITLKTIRIEVEGRQDFYFPNVFSPNGDGKNDIFTISDNSGTGRITKLNIYDRSGSLIFSKEDFPTNVPSMGWSGTSIARKIQSGIYVFIVQIQFENGTEA